MIPPALMKLLASRKGGHPLMNHLEQGKGMKMGDELGMLEQLQQRDPTGLPSFMMNQDIQQPSGIPSLLLKSLRK